MANDYNIYVRYKNESTSNNRVIPNRTSSVPKAVEPTLPKEIVETSPEQIDLPHIDLSSLSFSSLATKVVNVWAITKSLEIADKVATTYLDLQSGYTGNYQNARNYNNFKTAISTTPMQFVSNILRAEMETKVDREKKEQEKLLLGGYSKGV